MPSQRLLTLASLCPTTGPLLDVGSDHGHLLKILFQQGFPFPLFGSELTLASFQSLKKSVEDFPFTIYQANGLQDLPKGIATIVIAGMGGLLMIEILTQGFDHLTSIQHLVLGPQRDAHHLRYWLADHGWQIRAERFVLEGNQGYPLLLASPGKMVLTDIEARYGPKLIAQRDPGLLSWLPEEKLALATALSFRHDDDKQRRLEWIEHYVKN
jgi:tRNA (adenine22-N1)-methyltransferase